MFGCNAKYASPSSPAAAIAHVVNIVFVRFDLDEIWSRKCNKIYSNYGPVM